MRAIAGNGDANLVEKESLQRKVDMLTLYACCRPLGKPSSRDERSMKVNLQDQVAMVTLDHRVTIDEFPRAE